MATSRNFSGAPESGAGAQARSGESSDLLPERPGDEHDTSWDWREGLADDDERYLRERPPHHEG